MTSQEYLEQIGVLENKIKRMKDRSEYYDQMSLSVPGPCYDKIGSSGTRNLQAPFEKWIYKKLEIDAEIKVLEEKLKDLKSEIAIKIENLPTEELKNLAVMRYFKYMSWIDIGSKLYVSKATVYRLRDQVLSLIKVDT